ncbi:glycosyltransferase family 61 protein [Puniceicoccus vermicola]|uniref:Glycosyltransferase family 61 protein n=1 Tax=Puniceicoccus vermicola TaxID=388746 RepID=A0A7X1AWB9_9BACT|nr:glycosyltransferase family 61 protein [Puniceicoccus vermicola]MBC2601094.1 glycosyltransferase family 61 protein [Puniceicoccus vermicola]
MSNRGTVLTPGHKLLFDVSNQMSVRRDFAKVQFHQAFQRNIFPPIRRVQGRVAVLVTAAGGNYFHWLTEALPRLRLLEIAEGGIDRIDSFVVNQGASFIGESLDLLGVPLSRRIDTDWNTHLKADELLVPSLPGVTLNPPRWACSFLQERMLPHGAPSGKGPRIYIRRGQTNRRFVRNEEEILAVLEDFGFVSVDPGEFDLKEQIAIFRDAEVIVGSHGAALANLLWCGSGTKVLELLPLHRPGKWFWPYCYWALSASCDLDYHCLQSLETDGDHDKELYADQSFSSTEIRQWLEHHV